MKTQIFLLLLFILSSCDNLTKNTDNENVIHKETLSGYAQKGPYLNGASITIFELDENLNQTGKTFNTQISNNAGSFTLSDLDLISQYVMLKVDGYYFNEVIGQNENAPLTLYALSDITDLTTLNVNILTYLEKDRVEYLFNNGVNFSLAKDSAQKEILNTFSMFEDDISNSETLDISQTGEGNTILLAISIILQSNRSISEFTEFLANFINIFKELGQINDSAFVSQLYKGINILDLSTIRQNLESRYSELGMVVEIGNFEDYVDNFIHQQNEILCTYERNISCDGSLNSSIDLTVSGGTAPYQYSWSDGSSNEDIENIGPGNYSVTIIDAYSQSMIITDLSIPDKIFLAANMTQISNQNPEGAIDLIITGGESPFSYSWSNGLDTEDISGLGEGEYSVTVTDMNSCQESISLDIVDLDSEVVDVDGNTYNIVSIGTQIWLKQNLKVTHFQNGDPIQSVADSIQWMNCTSSAYCIYQNDVNNVATYGRLYNWHAINDSRNIALSGWHVPTDDEWQTLVDYLGGNAVAGGKMKEGGILHWKSPNTDATNESGFTSLPGGFRYDHGYFAYIGERAVFWSATESGSNDALFRILRYENSESINGIQSKGTGCSVRCIKD